jgi:uroporphyrinogen-III synthase
VVLSRPPAKADWLVEALRAAGAEVVCVPCIATSTVELTPGLRATLQQLEQFTWAGFASQQAVTSLHSLLCDAGLRWPKSLGLVAVGGATAAALRRVAGDSARLHQAAVQRAEGLLEALLAQTSPQRDRILLPGAQAGRRHVFVELQRRGYAVERGIVYRTELQKPSVTSWHIGSTRPIVVCTSPSALRGLLGQLNLPAAARLISMGPSTTAACRKVGLHVAQEASPHSLEGLLQATLAVAAQSLGG